MFQSRIFHEHRVRVNLKIDKILSIHQILESKSPDIEHVYQDLIEYFFQ